MGCSDTAPSMAGEALNFSGSVSEGTLRLSHAPDRVAEVGAISETEVPGARLPVSADLFQHPSDVTAVGDSLLAVADRMARNVVLLHRDGRVLRTIGRAGEGPGEFLGPLAIEEVGRGVVVLDQAPTKAFTLFRTHDWTVQATFPLPPGDLFGSVWREPNLDLERPYQAGPEDWTRRLSASVGAFYYLQEDDERNHIHGGGKGPTMVLLRYRAEPPVVIDTLATWPAPGATAFALPVTDKAGNPIEVFRPSTVQPILTARPLVAAGDDWFAVHAPSDTAVTVRASEAEAALLRIVWPAGARRTTEADRLATARLRALSTDRMLGREGGAGGSPASDRVRAIADNLASSYSETLPELTAMFGTGECLWMAGANPADHIDGTARRLIGLRVRPPFTDPRVIRLEGPEDLRIRDVAPWGFISSFRDEWNRIVFLIHEVPTCW